MNKLSESGRLSILGVHVSILTMQRATATMENWIRNGERHYVCITGVHGVMESQRDPELMAIHNAAGLVTPDGVPMVWMSHWLGHPEVERVYGPDLLQEMCRISALKGYRHFFYGSTPETLGKLTAALTRRHPGLQVVGSFAPPFRPLTPEEDEAVIAQINASGAQIVWVGLSTPKQERWMASHVDRLNASVLVGVGAAFDFAAGEKQQAPRWMQRNGLEWAFRLASEPRRLAGRYFRNNPAFMLRALAQLLRHHGMSRTRRADRMAP
ncbi:WecB/TagA/CpsF family glycosyltransferase [Falsiroseomonas tokyonensis]|uniref:WecB/TagA/CpsF family glycosyltransferase n=1 Tax=Falsiroseomonas tokyonensis TaxID=430521 RepID=A0ABV7C3I3_9PROT|nr:WecB/TagA/CpsF family glycosyltransferase [Falsiroseomonas tokyonensis]MBU8541452.1 WecB/TagA/CpsF family glycosyltransferase [Falsiroseomonas tokyonensis]